jgi:hypothetical protein
LVNQDQLKQQRKLLQKRKHKIVLVISE